MAFFILVTTLAYGLVVWAGLAGGFWVWAALLYLTLLVASLDHLITRSTRNADPEAEFPTATPLLAWAGACGLQ